MTGVEFTDTITLGGAILMAISTFGAVIGVVYGTRYRVAFEAASHAADELRKALQDAELRVDHLEEEIRELRGRLLELSRRPDLSRLEQVIIKHENRAEERHRQSLALFERIADRLEAR